jgi:hypothetical protein
MAADWGVVSRKLDGAAGIAFDTCHKIYILMDKRQVDLMRECKYEHLHTAEEMSVDEMFAAVKWWYANSCGLRFVQSVATAPGDDVFEVLIAQGIR